MFKMLRVKQSKSGESLGEADEGDGQRGRKPDIQRVCRSGQERPVPSLSWKNCEINHSKQECNTYCTKYNPAGLSLDLPFWEVVFPFTSKCHNHDKT